MDQSVRPNLEILLAAPRGFCAGVDRAIEIVHRAIARFGPPVYVRHEIVHNRFVVEALEAKGAVFVEELDEVPDEMPVIFSAHGVPRSVPEEASRRGLTWLDATCPLVSKVHRETERWHKDGRQVILIGHRGHPEVIGTMGQVPDGAILLVEDETQAEAVAPADPDNVAYVTQTTLSVDETESIIAVLKRRFPAISGPRSEDICYATTNRQAAVKAMAPETDAIIVLGAPNSSNSNRLREVALKAGCPHAIMIQRAAEIDWSTFQGVRRLGITAGASAPEVLVQEVIDSARTRFEVEVSTISVAEERIVFKLPAALADRG